MTEKNIDYRLTVAIEKFADDYKEKLNQHESELDEANYNALYDLGAIIRNTLDDIRAIATENREE